MYCRSLSRVFCLMMVCCSLVVVAGCGGGDKVGGKVTFEDGTALSGGTVVFMGSDAEERAQIGEDGMYKLKEGLPDGEYAVLVTWTKSKDNTDSEEGDVEAKEDDEASYDVETENLVHLDFSDREKSGLKYTAPGESTFDIKVKKP